MTKEAFMSPNSVYVKEMSLRLTSSFQQEPHEIFSKNEKIATKDQHGLSMQVCRAFESAKSQHVEATIWIPFRHKATRDFEATAVGANRSGPKVPVLLDIMA
ncbi:hypothetical protein AMTR_s00159p00082140 [Amborella trichopoda]|uniref:Uncharacterized protein n=1 Tax=Amborella trichopoda TaxID=13333 RepID=W1PWA9_AMBTC|nr:hypothetical protein AMTR_s00159p00082140 [Amborella trichopoda]